jgi:hypothetical protein
VREDHERIDELFAGYVLRSLSVEDAAEADRLLTEHVPSCLACRRTLSAFEGVAGDLALSVDPVALPDLSLARIHRSIDRPTVGAAARRGAFAGFAATAVVLLALGGLSLAMMNRAQDAETRTEIAIELASLMASPGVSPAAVEPQGTTPSNSDFVQVSAPDIRRMYVAAKLCPDPAPGHAYQLWLGSDGEFRPYGPMFLPDDGIVLLELIVDISVYDEIWITEELADTQPTQPRTAGRSWRGALA